MSGKVQYGAVSESKSLTGKEARDPTSPSSHHPPHIHTPSTRIPNPHLPKPHLPKPNLPNPNIPNTNPQPTPPPIPPKTNMVPLPAIRASNASIKSHLPNPTALFVGGTSGIGLSTLEHLALNTTAPTIYLVGRSEAAGARIVEDLKTNINPAGTYEFIAADCTLLANVDRVCAEVKERLRGRKLDIIVLSCGYLSFGGREGAYPSPDSHPHSHPPPLANPPHAPPPLPKLTSPLRNDRRPRQTPHPPLLRAPALHHKPPPPAPLPHPLNPRRHHRKHPKPH